MLFKIDEKCICCGACQPECPVEAITEGEDIYIIEEDLCTGCAVCVDMCPVEAIVKT